MGKMFRAWQRLGLSIQIIIGLALGIFAGLFFGESARELEPLSDIYIRLMQMTVLPYLITALVVAFGQLDMTQAKKLALRGGLLLVVVWAIMIVVLFITPMAFPAMTSAGFFSTALVEPPRDFSLADIYFTANPFQSLSQNVVPAVVLFSCLLGVALIRVKNKETLLSPLRIWNEAIVLITRYVIALTPYGVFAIGAVTAGTMSAETFIRLEAYFIAFGAVSLLLCFVILPLLVTAVTPFSYREVVGIAKDALLTAFVTHNAFIVMPILIERSKALFERHSVLDETTDSAADVMIPVLFNFPNAGKLMTLLFIPFAAWLSGSALGLDEYPQLFAAGIPSYFAKAQVALPFLLDLFSLPHDLFLLYIPTTIVTGKFDSMVTAMNLLVFALLGAGAMGGFLVMEKGRILRALALAAAATLLTVIGVRVILGLTIDTSYHLDQAVREMRLDDLGSNVRVLREAPGQVSTGPRTLDEIRQSGVLRIGYEPDNLPFSFFNQADELVGFDVELAIRMASELELAAEFVPIRWSGLVDMLEQGQIDVMPGMWYRPNWFGRLQLSAPYVEGTMALATRDERRHEFASIPELHRSEGLKIGIPLDQRQNHYSIERYFGPAEVEFRVVEFWSSYFQGEHEDLDAFLLPAEHASGWTLLYPQYTVVVPQPDPIRVSTSFGIANGAHELMSAINEWVVFADDTGAVDRAYDYWVLGQGAGSQEPRWSIMRNVLGWGD